MLLAIDLFLAMLAVKDFTKIYNFNISCSNLKRLTCYSILIDVVAQCKIKPLLHLAQETRNYLACNKDYNTFFQRVMHYSSVSQKYAQYRQAVPSICYQNNQTFTQGNISISNNNLRYFLYALLGNVKQHLLQLCYLKDKTELPAILQEDLKDNINNYKRGYYAFNPQLNNSSLPIARQYFIVNCLIDKEIIRQELTLCNICAYAEHYKTFVLRLTALC